MKKKILVIDDEETILHTIKLILDDMGFDVSICQNPDRGIEEAVKNNYDLIISDLRMPEKTGDEITEAIVRAKSSARILILTAYPTDPLAKKALDAGALSLLKKPFEIAKILDFLR